MKGRLRAGLEPSVFTGSSVVAARCGCRHMAQESPPPAPVPLAPLRDLGAHSFGEPVLGEGAAPKSQQIWRWGTEWESYLDSMCTWTVPLAFQRPCGISSRSGAVPLKGPGSLWRKPLREAHACMVVSQPSIRPFTLLCGQCANCGWVEWAQPRSDQPGRCPL